MLVRPSIESVLRALRAKARLVEVGREFNLPVALEASLDQQVSTIAGAEAVPFRDLLAALGRDELKAACRAHGLDPSGRDRGALATRLLEAHGEKAPGTGRFALPPVRRTTPRVGDVVQVRHRQYLVEAVTPPLEPSQATRVALAGLDDDNQGRRLEVLWELELGARVHQPEASGLGEKPGLDPPRLFAAYLHAIQWSGVTATDARLFQSPFRAGIKLFTHQLAPLKKALELPRANLFIADDVGLGKTIEAGLVLQELLLRQRVEFVLIVCPASVGLQWRDEMQKRFGLYFEVFNRAFVGRRRRERGFGVNPWSTHSRFIISYQTIRRPEYRDPLLQHIQERGGLRVRKSLLILDEAHTVAPSTASQYATDTNTTRLARDLAPRFENRLFLSATPHNGHSNSFSALLEILDPQRFTRGVPVTSRRRLEPVMVRRLKDDLRELGIPGYPERKVVQIALAHDDGKWSARTTSLSRGSAPVPFAGCLAEAHVTALGSADDAELELSTALAHYTSLARPAKDRRGRLVFTNLQKRLLSSVEAFHRTLKLHAESVGREAAAATPEPTAESNDDDEYGADDDALEAQAGAEVAAASRLVLTPEGRARELLGRLLALSEQRRTAPDAKVRALVAWIQRHQCAAVEIGGAAEKARKTDRAWSDRRLIVFTEYGDTKRYLTSQLRAAIEGTDDADDRIMHFHGGMSDDQREEVQRAWNSAPSENAVRILLATDAAREGVNLQGSCADLLHFDVPWNPARMEQRNGRIDRALQPAPVVRCHYFVYPQRAEDAVLDKLVEKVDTIQRELGSLGSVVMDRLAATLEDGIDERTGEALERAARPDAKLDVTREELEAQRTDLTKLKQEIDEAGTILDASREVVAFDPRLLHDAIDVGLDLAGGKKLAPVEVPGFAEAFALPELPESWQETLDTLRPPRARDEAPWDWRKRPPLPVVFKAPDAMTSSVAQLHLQHPLVQRVLSRFLAQGTSAHDLARVTAVVNPHDATARVIVFGRLSLFGPGATRLHDRLVRVVAAWFESKGPKHLQPLEDRAAQKALVKLEELLAEGAADRVPPKIRERLVASATDDFKKLWPHVKSEADALAHEAERKLKARGVAEADALRKILEEQRAAIRAEIKKREQREIAFTPEQLAEREQFEQDKKHMAARLDAIEKELVEEPPLIADLYRRVLTRLEPVGLVYLWPETRA